MDIPALIGRLGSADQKVWVDAHRALVEFGAVHPFRDAMD